MQDKRNLEEIHSFSQGSKFYRGDKNHGKQSLSAEIIKLHQLKEPGNADLIICDPRIKQQTIFEKAKYFVKSILKK